MNIMVGGEAGQGVQTIGFVLAKALARGGLDVFADQDYESRIRGGHNFFRVRAGTDGEQAPDRELDVLVALNPETVELHGAEVKADGVVLFDREKAGGAAGPRLLDVPLDRMARETTSNPLMANSVATGATVGLAGYDFDILAGVLRQQFAKSGEVAEANVKAARAGYDFALKAGQAAPGRQAKPTDRPRKMLLSGNEALALGAMAAGCRFVAAYPMTPTTSIMEYMADKGRAHGVAVVQTEDEIAAVNMVIGAAYAGVRAMTATSGSGFCLMVEGLGLAGITETPIVVVLGQRPGPAVGLPTRTEQGDLLFAVHAGTGEFPRAVLAPATIEGCFHAAVRAFNLAEKYQTPVIILTDHVLSTSYATVSKFDLGQVSVERGPMLSDEQAEREVDYKRHRITASGVSPRALPLQGRALVVTDSDEHDEAGHLIEDAATRKAMVEKRLRKLEGLRADMGQPRLHARPGARATLVGWGSTYPAIIEAAALLEKQGTAVNVLHLDQVWPFPAQGVAQALSGAEKTLAVENNATGQLARLIRAETGIQVGGNVSRYDGRPFLPGDIAAAVQKEVG